MFYMATPSIAEMV